jgi:hypothetical protein
MLAAPSDSLHMRLGGRSASSLIDPRAEAFERLEGAYEVRVLEPSPPAVQKPPWYADDPAARGWVPPGRRVVSPVSSGDVTWNELAARDPELRDWCADRWLGAWRRLERVPFGLAATRRSLRHLAARVISPVRERANGHVGLRWTRGGFGTPFFGADSQVRYQDGVLIVVSPEGERRAAVTTLAGAAELIGFELLEEDVELRAEPLVIKPTASRFLSSFLGFATGVLEQVRAESPPHYDATRVELWPEALDMQVELGLEEYGLRTVCGASPGDGEHPEPYLYVAPQSLRPVGALWSRNFVGARLTYAELLAAADQRGCALDFFHTRVDALHHALRL